MKFLHLGDLHLGKTLGEYDLTSDQKYILDRVIEMALENSVDGVLIAGDVYDKSIPSEAAVNLLDDFIRRLAELKIKTFLISGNHDSDDRLNFGSSLFEAEGIFISSRFQGGMKCYRLEDEFGALNVYLLPFVKASQVRHFYPDLKIENYDDAVRAIIENSDIDFTGRNILVAHQFVAGNDDPQMAGSENIATLSVGLVEKIGYNAFKDFDYVALGHIHSPQKVGLEHIRYSGSLLKYSLSEASNEKSVPLINMGKKGDVTVSLLPLKPRRDLRHIKGTLEKLLDEKNITDPEDFMYVTLTDEDIISDVMGIVRQYYPNTVKVDYDNSHTREIERVEAFAYAESRTYSELISDFYKQVYGCEINDEELEIMEAVAREAGVLGEAD